MDSLKPIKLSIAEKLKQKKAFRLGFFRAKSRDNVTLEIGKMRRQRRVSVSTLAKDCGMKQPAMSRILDSEYSSWTFNTLIRLAEAMDAVWEFRLRPAEEVIKEYEKQEIQVASATTTPRLVGIGHALIGGAAQIPHNDWRRTLSTPVQKMN